MPAANLDEVGVRAVFEGFQQYLNEVGAFNRATDSTAKSVQRAAAATQRAGALNKQFAQTVGISSRTAINFGLGMLGAQSGILAVQGALGGTIGAAISFEDTFAGIRKTVDASEEEFQALADANRALARELPQTVDEINRIGELGGALGITGTSNILKFERTVADLASTTDLTADAAATATAQLLNIFDAPIATIDRLGSALVDLGNKSAATESAILEFSQRIGAAGKIAGLTIAEVEAIGAAFASVGIEPEAGGTAVQKVLIEITQAAAEGNAKLDKFAAAVGLTREQFQQLVKDNPAEAFTLFVEALGKAGDQAFAILEGLDFNDVRLTRSILSAAQAGDLLRRSIEIGNTAFRENTALTVEAEKRYATTASQLKILRNNLRDAGIELGNEFLPSLVKSGQAGSSMARSLAPLAPLLSDGARAAVLFGAALAAIKLAQFTKQAITARTATLSLGSALASPAGAAGVFTLAVVGLDQALQAFSGQGLLDFFTGAKKKAAEAAEAAGLLNAELKILQQFQESRGTDEGAVAFLDRQIAQIEEQRLAFLEAVAQARRDFAEGRIGGGEFFERVEDANEKFKDDVVATTKAAIEAIDSIPPAQQSAIIIRLQQALREINRFDPLQVEGGRPSALFDERLNVDQFIKDLEAQLKGVPALIEAALTPEETAQRKLFEQAAGDVGAYAVELDKATESTEATGDALKATAEQAQAFADALESAAETAVGATDSVSLALEIEIGKLEQQKSALEASGQATDGVDAKIASLRNTLEAHNREAELATQSLELFGARAVDAMGGTGEAVDKARDLVEKLEAAIDDLPRQQRIDILLALPDLEMTRFLTFLKLIEQGVTVPVALRVAQAPARTVDPNAPFIGGPLGGIDPEGVAEFNREQEAQALRDIAFEEAQKEAARLVGAANDAAGAFTKTADGASYLERVLSAAADGVITLAEAVELHLTDEQVVTLELEAARNAEAEAAFRQRIELLTLARVFPGLTAEQIRFATALGAIQKHLRETGQTINQFIYDTATTALEGFKAAFNEIFNRPTRETLELRRRLTSLEITRLRRKGAGASDESLEALDKEIESIQGLIELREREAELLKIETELRDKTLQTDQDVKRQAELFGIAIEQASTEVEKFKAAAFFDVLAHFNVGNAANEAAAALRNLAGSAGGAIPQDSGGVVRGPALVRVGAGVTEAFIPTTATAERAREIIATLPPGAVGGGGVAIDFHPGVTLQQVQADLASAKRVLHRLVDEIEGNSRSRASNLGTSLEVGIG